MRGRPDLKPNRGQGAHQADEVLRVFRVGDEVNVDEEVRPVDGVSDVSQVPVLAGDRVVGILDESDVLLHVYKQPRRFRDHVATAMTQRLETLDPSADFSELLSVLNHDYVAIIVHDGRFFGLITRYDLLTYLRRSLP